MGKFTSAIALLFSSYAAAAVPSLTPANYDSMTDGKTVFIKFFAPWCGHCKKMAPDWQSLADEWANNEIGLIAEVDCTTDGKQLCERFGVKGFPSIKYGDPTALEDYTGGRTFKDLSIFAKFNLKPMCSPSKLDLCDDEKKATIENLLALPASELSDRIAAEEKKIADAESKFESEVQKLKEQHEELTATKDAVRKEVTKKGLGLMNSVKAYNAKKNDAKDEL